MKFLKISTVLVFLLSLASCGITLFLSTIRENEKEKRLYLEGVRTELEGRVQGLEGEKAKFQRQVSELSSRVQGLENQNRDLGTQLRTERQERARATNLVRKQESELSGLRIQLNGVERALADSKKRIQELEKVLEELEARVKETAASEALGESEAAYVGLTLPPVAPPPQPAAESPPTSRQKISTQPPRETPQELQAGPVPKIELSEKTVGHPPVVRQKKRRFFSFLRRRDSSRISEKPSPGERKPEVLPVETKEKAGGEALEEPKPAELKRVPMKPLVQAKPVTVEALKVDQPKVEVRPAPEKKGAVRQGRVLLINREFNFLVTDLGSKQGLALDDVLSIEKNGSEVAKVRVEKIYDDYAAAYIMEEQSEFPIEEGNLVRPPH